ncbi:conserved hypothetical protein [Trichinella spiralis]|uniref:hypothetical protein n=1 Tax=Trichinella spiralis TaxID=6334 RepID=UPI0001EFEF5C|nr:conserved hypothetical protein [Trichinella spiralis]
MLINFGEIFVRLCKIVSTSTRSRKVHNYKSSRTRKSVINFTMMMIIGLFADEVVRSTAIAIQVFQTTRVNMYTNCQKLIIDFLVNYVIIPIQLEPPPVYCKQPREYNSSQTGVPSGRSKAPTFFKNVIVSIMPRSKYSRSSLSEGGISACLPRTIRCNIGLTVERANGDVRPPSTHCCNFQPLKSTLSPFIISSLNQYTYKLKTERAVFPQTDTTTILTINFESLQTNIALTSEPAEAPPVRLKRFNSDGP